MLSRPGIQRDGTRFDSDAYTDGSWVRWQRGRPRKIAGYRQIFDQADGISRGINSFPSENQLYVHSGAQETLQRIILDVNTYLTAGVADRTPSGFVDSINNLWQFDQMYDATSEDTFLIAHAAQNAMDIASEIDAEVYVGDITADAALTAVPDGGGTLMVSGGVVVLHPYAFAFGSDGLIRQSVANKPADFTGTGSNSFRATAQKVVRGMALRGGAGNAPSGLFWSLDRIIRAAFIGGSPVFSYDTISNESGILAAQSVIEYDGVYYWIGIGRFMFFNGVVHELPNTSNLNFFFENLNWPYRNKVFAYKVPKFGEIWWCFPKYPSTEPNWAVIYSTNEKCWFDTELPNGGRSAGDNPASYRFPLLAGITPDADTDLYKLWQHEIGVDEVSGNPLRSHAIRSSYTTHEVSLTTGTPAIGKGISVGIIEPDFIQSGDLTLTVMGRANPRAADIISNDGPQTFVADPITPEQQLTNFKFSQRLVRFQIESNVAGGDYQSGKPLVHIAPSDERILGRVS